jgi:cyclic beta-1,2-glucan synthetase
VHALGNRDPHIHFALLTDFPDAVEPSLPGEDAVLAAAVAGIEALNARYAAELAGRFHLFHRARRMNASEGVWMGWERKRGKIEEFNRLLRGATDTGFIVQVGEAAFLPDVRYCITLDSDTRLPRDAARRLIGVIEHPLNRPRLDPKLGRVVEGYGILQPRVSVTMASAAGSLFARAYAGHTGIDPYSTTASDTYQDLFGEGSFTGKGLYDVDAFSAALADRVPENAMLSHDLFEGLYARCALVSDVELVDDFPSSVLAHARRQHRWVRGDWQVLLMPAAGHAHPARARAHAAHTHQSLEGARQPAPQPIGAGFVAAPGLGVVVAARLTGGLDAGDAGGVRVPAAAAVAALGAWAPAHSSRSGCSCTTWAQNCKPPAAQGLLQITLLAYHAYEMAHAIVLTLVRMVITQRRLLEWETAAAGAGARRGAAWRARALASSSPRCGQALSRRLSCSWERCRCAATRSRWRRRSCSCGWYRP